MRRFTLPFLLLWPAAALAQTADVNPLSGYVWQYYGPTLGAGWGPVASSSLPAITDGVLSIVNGALRSGTGTPATPFGATTPTIWEIAEGSSGSPVTAAHTQIRMTKYKSVLKSLCAGNPAASGCTAPLAISVIGDTTDEMMSSAVSFHASSSSQVPNADAQPINGIGKLTGNAAVNGMGAFLIGINSTISGTGNVWGAEISAWNNTGLNFCAVFTAANGRCDGVRATAYSNNPTDILSSAIHVETGDLRGVWAQAITINSNAVAPGGTTYNDASISQTAFNVANTHTYALTSAPTSGLWGFGTLSPGARVDIGGNMSSPYWAGLGIALRLEGATYTDTTSSGTAAFNAVSSIARPTIAAAHPVTISSANTVFIEDCPIAGANVSITSCWALSVGGDIATSGFLASTGAAQFAGNIQSGSLTTSGSLRMGASFMTLSDGEIGFNKILASGVAPGATGAKLAVVCGTNAGSAKVIAYAGTSTTPITIADNIGAGVTGC